MFFVLTWLILAGLVTILMNNVKMSYNGNRQVPTYNNVHLSSHTHVHCVSTCDNAFCSVFKGEPDTCHTELVVNLYCTRHAAGTTCMKHGLQIATTLQDMLLA